MATTDELDPRETKPICRGQDEWQLLHRERVMRNPSQKGACRTRPICEPGRARFRGGRAKQSQFGLGMTGGWPFRGRVPSHSCDAGRPLFRRQCGGCRFKMVSRLDRESPAENVDRSLRMGATATPAWAGGRGWRRHAYASVSMAPVLEKDPSPRYLAGIEWFGHGRRQRAIEQQTKRRRRRHGGKRSRFHPADRLQGQTTHFG